MLAFSLCYFSDSCKIKICAKKIPMRAILSTLIGLVLLENGSSCDNCNKKVHPEFVSPIASSRYGVSSDSKQASRLIDSVGFANRIPSDYSIFPDMKSHNRYRPVRARTTKSWVRPSSSSEYRTRSSSSVGSKNRRSKTSRRYISLKSGDLAEIIKAVQGVQNASNVAPVTCPGSQCTYAQGVSIVAPSGCAGSQCAYGQYVPYANQGVPQNYNQQPMIPYHQAVYTPPSYTPTCTNCQYATNSNPSSGGTPTWATSASHDTTLSQSQTSSSSSHRCTSAGCVLRRNTPL